MTRIKDITDRVVRTTMHALDAGEDLQEALAAAGTEYARTPDHTGLPPLRLMLGLRDALRQREPSTEMSTVCAALVAPMAQHHEGEVAATVAPEARDGRPGRANGTSSGKSWEVLYATDSRVEAIHQTTLSESPPEGFTDGVCLLPVVPPDEAQIPPTPWLVEGWIKLKRLAVLSALYKSLKSYVARQLALGVASGLPFLGVHRIHESAKRGSVVIVCAEEEYSDVLWTLNRAARGLGLSSEAFAALPIRILPAIGLDFFRRDMETGMPEPTRTFHAAERGCSEVSADLIVIDTLIGVKGDARENSNDDMRPVFTHFRLLGKRLDATVVVVDHEGHSELAAQGRIVAKGRPRGASDKLGAVDDIISLSTTQRTEEVYDVDAHMKHRGAADSVQKFTVVFEREEAVHFVGPDSPHTAGTLHEEGKDLLMHLASGAMSSKRKLQVALGLTSPDHLKELLASHSSLVEFESHGKGKADVPRLTAEGRKLAKELGFEVLGNGGAQNDVD